MVLQFSYSFDSVQFHHMIKIDNNKFSEHLGFIEYDRIHNFISKIRCFDFTIILLAIEIVGKKPKIQYLNSLYEIREHFNRCTKRLE